MAQRVPDEVYNRLEDEIMNVLSSNPRWFEVSTLNSRSRLFEVEHEEIEYEATDWKGNPTTRTKFNTTLHWASDGTPVPEELLLHRMGYVPEINPDRIRTALNRLVRAGLVIERQGALLARGRGSTANRYARLYQTPVQATKIEELEAKATERKERIKRALKDETLRAIEVLREAGIGVKESQVNLGVIRIDTPMTVKENR